MHRKIIYWKLRDREMQLGERTLVMGVLNVTPDSFSDGGRYNDPDKAYARALELEEQGADIIDIGAESTRPGAEPVSADEEWRRLVPLLKRLRGALTVPVSLDTYKSETAERALSYDVQILNDPSGLTFDPGLAKVAAAGDMGLVLNHMRGRPEQWAKMGPLSDAIGTVLRELDATVSRARHAGVDRQRIAIDPGIGFGKRKEQNSELIAQLSQLASLELPILVGASRKSFLAQSTEVETLYATAAAVTAAILNGAHMVRVHDVKEMLAVIRVADEIAKSAAVPVDPQVERAAQKPRGVAKLPVWEEERAKPTRPPIRRHEPTAEPPSEAPSEAPSEFAAGTQTEAENPALPKPVEKRNIPPAGDSERPAQWERPNRPLRRPDDRPVRDSNERPFKRPDEGPSFRRDDRPPYRREDRPAAGGGRPSADRGEGRFSRPGDRPFGKPGDRPFSKPGDRPFGRSGDRPFARPGDRPFNKSGDRPFSKPGDRPFNKPGDRPFGRSGDRPFSKPGDRPFSKPGDRPFGRSGDRSFSKPGDRPFNKPGDRPFSRPGDRPFNKPGDRPFSRPGDRPLNKPGDRPLNKPGDRPFSKPGDRPFNKPGGRPFSKPGGRPFSRPGDRPFSRPPGDRPSGDTGDRPTSNSGDRPFSRPPGDRPPFNKFGPNRGGGRPGGGGTRGGGRPGGGPRKPFRKG